MESEFIILNKGQHTRRDERNNKTFAVDISLAPKDINPNLQWHSKQESVGYHHFPIVIEWEKTIDFSKSITKINWNNVVQKLMILSPIIHLVLKI